VAEVHEGSIAGEEGKGQVKEERVLRPDAEGKLAVQERTVSRDAENGPGNSQTTSETYSNFVPGVAGDGKLSLNRRVQTVRRTGLAGVQTSEETVEERSGGTPADGVRPTQSTIDVVRPGRKGGSATSRTVVSIQSNGAAQTVWVDTSQKQTSNAVTVSTQPQPPK
jgi:hypothetical protein